MQTSRRFLFAVGVVQRWFCSIWPCVFHVLEFFTLLQIDSYYCEDIFPRVHNPLFNHAVGFFRFSPTPDPHTSFTNRLPLARSYVTHWFLFVFWYCMACNFYIIVRATVILTFHFNWHFLCYIVVFFVHSLHKNNSGSICGIVAWSQALKFCNTCYDFISTFVFMPLVNNPVHVEITFVF